MSTIASLRVVFLVPSREVATILGDLSLHLLRISVQLGFKCLPAAARLALGIRHDLVEIVDGIRGFLANEMAGCLDVVLHQLTCFTAYAIMALGLLGFGSVFVSF